MKLNVHGMDQRQDKVNSLVQTSTNTLKVELHIPQELHRRFIKLHEERFYRDSTVNDLFLVCLRNGIKKIEDRRKKKQKERAKMNLAGGAQ